LIARPGFRLSLSSGRPTGNASGRPDGKLRPDPWLNPGYTLSAPEVI
jgi:hypothetical protein